jgi:hypothetical protein
VSWSNNKQCECGQIATIKKASGAICVRCNRIEVEMIHQQGRENKKISCGSGSLGDTYTVAIRSMPGAVRRSL